MASIYTRTRADGSKVYRATVRIKQHGEVVFSESNTFKRKAAAQSWAKRLELELEKPGGLEQRKTSGLTVGQLITKYLDEIGSVKPLGRTKLFTLQKLKSSKLANVNASQLQSKHVIEHCKLRKNEGAGPATVYHDIAYLRAVLSVASPVWGLAIDETAIDMAQPTLKKLNLIGKSQKRDRRPTKDELELLKSTFIERDKTSEIPMADILEFAIYSAMRQSEITSLRWEDLDHDKKTVMIRARKDPSNKSTNDQVVPLLGEAWDIAIRQERTSDKIFPYNSKSIGAAFTRTCAKLKITDLRFHDLRHEGASRLFELGYSIEQVALVTGHKDWNMLRRYTQLKPESLHRN